MPNFEIALTVFPDYLLQYFSRSNWSNSSSSCSCTFTLLPVFGSTLLIGRRSGYRHWTIFGAGTTEEPSSISPTPTSIAWVSTRAACFCLGTIWAPGIMSSWFSFRWQISWEQLLRPTCLESWRCLFIILIRRRSFFRRRLIRSTQLWTIWTCPRRFRRKSLGLLRRRSTRRISRKS